MTKPSRKPANFTIRRDDGREVFNPAAYRLNIRALRSFMENEAESSGDCLTLTNTDTRNFWMVDEAGRWM